MSGALRGQYLIDRVPPLLRRQACRLIIAVLPDNSAVDLVKSNVLLRDKSLSRKAKKA